jgi:biopolymer transport protein ExbB
MIVEQLSILLDRIGAAWVLYTLAAMSLLSLAIAVERLLFLRARRVPVAALEADLFAALDRGAEHASRLLAPYRGMAARVPFAALAHLHRGPQAVEEVMSAREAAEHKTYEQFLGWLGSIGSNAPFVGLLGTVIGIMGAFAKLQLTAGAASASRNQLIMGSIAEALVATAVGLFVAIPAVVIYNLLRVRVKEAQADTRVLAGVVLAWSKQLPSVVAVQPEINRQLVRAGG